MNAETKLKYKFADVNGREYIINDKFIGVEGMTREEAVKKFYEITYSDEKVLNYETSWRWAKKAIAGFEALGLLKFEEEKKILGPVAAVKYCRNQYDDTGLMLEKLETDFGYKIVKV